MTRDTLSLLGCSSSLAFMLLAGNAAQAGTVSPQYAGYQGATKTSTSAQKAPVSQETPQPASLDAASDTVGDAAIAKFGCDCMSCRNAVVQMVQAGEMVLPR